MRKYASIDDLFILRQHNDILKAYMDSQVDLAKGTLELPTDAKLMTQMNGLFENGAMAALLKCVDGKSSEPYSVICHGDCWNNNLLYKTKVIGYQFLWAI